MGIRRGSCHSFDRASQAPLQAACRDSSGACWDFRPVPCPGGSRGAFPGCRAILKSGSAALVPRLCREANAPVQAMSLPLLRLCFRFWRGERVGCQQSGTQGRFVHHLKVATRRTHATPSTSDRSKRCRCLFAKEVAQLRIEHEVQVFRRSIERRERLARCPIRHAVEMRRLLRLW